MPKISESTFCNCIGSYGYVASYGDDSQVAIRVPTPQKLWGYNFHLTPNGKSKGLFACQMKYLTIERTYTTKITFG